MEPRALKPGQITVLHIDDDPNDTELLRAAASRADIHCVLHNVEDGDEAIAYLSGLGQFADRSIYSIPTLILLDLKMPRATGFEVLKWIRSHPELGKMPVIVLSGSELQEDIRLAYEIGANSYLIKPLGFDALVCLVRNINAFWLAETSRRRPDPISAPSRQYSQKRPA